MHHIFLCATSINIQLFSNFSLLHLRRLCCISPISAWLGIHSVSCCIILPCMFHHLIALQIVSPQLSLNQKGFGCLCLSCLILIIIEEWSEPIVVSCITWVVAYSSVYSTFARARSSRSRTRSPLHNVAQGEVQSFKDEIHLVSRIYKVIEGINFIL